QHARGEAADRAAHPLRVELVADAHRGERLVHHLAAGGVRGARRRELVLDARLFRVDDGAEILRSGARPFRLRAALAVDQDALAELPEGRELVFVLEGESLETEGRVGPWPIQLGDVHAEAQLRHGHAFSQRLTPSET